MENTEVQDKEEIKEEAVSYNEVLQLAMKLSPVERVKLIEKLAWTLRSDVRVGPPEPRRSVYGIAAHLGEGPSAEEIDQNRREMLAGSDLKDI